MALAELDRVHIWHHPSPFTTFHPKFYIFQGDTLAEIYIGSNNLTVGGLETNCEAGVRISYDLPAEATEWAVALSLWSELLNHPNTVRLDLKLLGQLSEQKKLLDETIMSSQPGGTGRTSSQTTTRLFPYSRIIPPSVRPRHAAPSRRAPRRSGARTESVSAAVLHPSLPAALVIQIVPHHNGEVFLSKLAVNQSPLFFGFPFTGLTIPKKSGNPPYPQRTPDPVTNWRVYDKHDRLIESLESYPLNTVFYERKGEIRITIPPEVAREIPPRSILLMTRPSQNAGLDYECEVFPPNSPQYRALRAACAETMPGGGSVTPRRFGWL